MSAINQENVKRIHYILNYYTVLKNKLLFDMLNSLDDLNYNQIMYYVCYPKAGQVFQALNLKNKHLLILRVDLFLVNSA